MKRKILMLLLCSCMFTVPVTPTYCAEDSGVTSGDVSGTENPNPDKDKDGHKDKPEKGDPGNTIQPHDAPGAPSTGH